VIPAVFNAGDRDAGAQAQVVHDFAVDVGLGPDVDAPGVDPAVILELGFLAHGEELGGDIAVVPVVGHMVPSVGLAQDGDGPVLVQHGDDGGVQGWVGAEAEGGAGGFADAHHQGVSFSGESRQRQAEHGHQGKRQNLGGFSSKSIHKWLLPFSYLL